MISTKGTIQLNSSYAREEFLHGSIEEFVKERFSEKNDPSYTKKYKVWITVEEDKAS